MIVPASAWVRALNALQNSMMLTPCWPRAGPTGGAGLAAPAGIWSLISVRTFLAIVRRTRIGHPLGVLLAVGCVHATHASATYTGADGPIS